LVDCRYTMDSTILCAHGRFGDIFGSLPIRGARRGSELSESGSGKSSLIRASDFLSNSKTYHYSIYNSETSIKFYLQFRNVY
jgi:hypothetical protein